MSNSTIVKEEIEIKDEVCENSTIETNDPTAIQNILIQNNAESLIGTDNDIAGVFTMETVGSKTLVVFKRFSGQLSVPVIPKIINNKCKGNNVTECNKCGEFITNRCLKLHSRECSINFKYQNCQFKTKDVQSLKKHNEEVHLHSSSILVHVCQKCGKSFKSPIHLKYTHHCKKVALAHYCDICPYRTLNKTRLRMHIQRVHNIHHDDIKMNKSTYDGKFTRFCSKCNMTMEPYSTGDCTSCAGECLWKCKQCSKVFSLHNSLTYHLEVQCNSVGHYYCPQCQFRSRLFGNIRKHMELHLKSGSTIDLNSIEWKKVPRDANGVKLQIHTCSKCCMTFAKSVQLNQHISKCGKPPIFKSANTNASSDSKFDKDKYLRMTYGSKKIVLHCEQCNKNIEGDRYFYCQQCENCQTNVKFRCTICDKLFTRYGRAVEHLNSTCDPQEMIQCSNCHFKAYTNSQISQHYKLFHSDIPMVDSRLLKQHLVCSKIERTFQCDHCPYKGKFKANIRNHLKTCHVNQPIDVNENSTASSKYSEKEAAQIKVHHFCFICNKRKVFPYRLKNCQRCKNAMHLWCIVCDKAFAIDNSKACKHIKTCLNIYSHECGPCARYFSSMEKLVYHNAHQCSKKIIHYSCSFCTSKFCSEKNLLRHEQIKHPKFSNQQVRGKLGQTENFTRSDLRTEKSHGKKCDLKGNVLARFFSCQNCNAKFVKNTNYSRHLKFCEAKLNMECKVLLTRLKIENM